MTWHDCDPWVKVYGACPVVKGGPPPKGAAAGDGLPADPSDEDEAPPPTDLGTPAIGHRPLGRKVIDGEKYEAQVLRELEEARSKEWEIPSTSPEWEKVAAAALMAGAAVLVTHGIRSAGAALRASEGRLPQHMRGISRPGPGFLQNWQEKLLNLEAIPQPNKKGWKKFYDTTGPGPSGPNQDPDVPGTGPALEDFGEWYYWTTGPSGPTPWRGPTWINPEDLDSTYTWWSGPENVTGRPGPPPSNIELPGQWEDTGELGNE